jgi:hypothetical protein
MFLKRKDFWIITGILVAASVPRVLLFQPYLATWDGAEYSFAVKNHYLVHLPYPIFQWIGLLFSSFFPPDIALSLVSLVAGIGSVLLVYFIVCRLFNRVCGLFASLFFVLTSNAVYFSTIQENHMLQVFFILSALALLLSEYKGKLIYSGLLYGMAVGVHIHSLVLAPFFFYLIALRSPKEIFKKCFRWTLLAAVVFGASWLWILALSPRWGGLKEGIDYFLPVLARKYNQARFSPAGLWLILKRNSIYMTNSSGHPGLMLLAFLGAAGLIWHKKRRELLLWLLFLAPYFIYEILSGEMDPGAHLLFINLPVAILASFSVSSFLCFVHQKVSVNMLVKRILLFLLILVSFFFIFQETLGKTFLAVWNPNFSQREGKTFEGCTIEDCLWIKENIPEEAKIVLWQEPWAVPYYSDRWPILVYRPADYQGPAKVSLAVNKGRWSPLNYWQVLDTSDLKELLGGGMEIFTLSQRPFVGSTVKEEEFAVDFYQSNEEITLYQVSVKNDE